MKRLIATVWVWVAILFGGQLLHAETAQCPTLEFERALAAQALAEETKILEQRIFATLDQLLLLWIDRALTATKSENPTERQTATALIYKLAPLLRLIHPSLELPLSFDTNVRQAAAAWQENLLTARGEFAYRYLVPKRGLYPVQKFSLRDLLDWADAHPLDTAVDEDRAVLEFLVRITTTDRMISSLYKRFCQLAGLVAFGEPSVRAVPQSPTKVRLFSEYDPPWRFLRRTLLHPSVPDRYRLIHQDAIAWLAADSVSAAAQALRFLELSGVAPTDIANLAQRIYNYVWFKSGAILRALYALKTPKSGSLALALIYFSRGHQTKVPTLSAKICAICSTQPPKVADSKAIARILLVAAAQIPSDFSVAPLLQTASILERGQPDKLWQRFARTGVAMFLSVRVGEEKPKVWFTTTLPCGIVVRSDRIER